MSDELIRLKAALAAIHNHLHAGNVNAALQEKLYLQVQAAERLVANRRQLADKLNDDPASTTYRERLRQCAKELEEALCAS